MNILAFSTGSAGPAFFSLGLRDTLVILLGVDIVACAIPAFLFVIAYTSSAITPHSISLFVAPYSARSWALGGWCKLASLGGMILTADIHSPTETENILNVFSMQGFLILDCIIGDQALASVSNHLDDTTGIVIIALVSLILTLFGYKFVHWFEVIAWVPNVIAFVVMLGVGGKHLKLSDYPTYPPASVKAITSYITFVAASVVSWCTMAPDYGVYHDAEASSLKIFLYTYAGFLTSNVAAQAIGAAFTAMAPAVPSWNEGFDKGNNLGGLISAILAPVGGFGKFLVALVALSIPSACAPTMYTFGEDWHNFSP
ncbi:hypothetical protein H0H93_016516 [Arthromyces matolae]|nr:hypothetical protein H0H93_016516 [Arthromyces matolae]